MKRLFAATALLSMLFLNAGALNAEVTVKKDAGFVSVTTTKNTQIDPDTVKITFSIETRNTELNKATQTNNEISNKLVPLLKAELGADDMIKTMNYSVNPSYYWKDNKQIFDTYIVTNQVMVTTKKVDNISKLIQLAISNGATGVNNLDFSSTQYQSQCDSLIAEATLMSFNQASSIAKVLKTELAGPKAVNAYCSSQSDRPMYMYAKMASGEANDYSGAAIEPGTLKINANVNASYYVK